MDNLKAVEKVNDFFHGFPLSVGRKWDKAAARFYPTSS